MAITDISLYQFRCFQRYKLELHPHLTVLAGPNGSGKTSVLEGIHSAALLRSFRTPLLSDLIADGAEAFSIEVTTDMEAIHVAYGRERRIVEINGVGPVTRLALMKSLPLITITEQDMALVDGAPSHRRSFCDYTIALSADEQHIDDLKKLGLLVKKRTALLADGYGWNRDVYMILTQQIWDVSSAIRQRRQAICRVIIAAMKRLLEGLETCYEPDLLYIPHETADAISVEEWCATHESRERALRRTLCGAHLDNADWLINGKNARRYASRGMQKLLMVFARSAQAQLLPRATFLLDDIMADFDEKRLEAIIPTIITIAEQTVITLPVFHDNAQEPTIIRHLGRYDKKIAWLP